MATTRTYSCQGRLREGCHLSGSQTPWGCLHHPQTAAAGRHPLQLLARAHHLRHSKTFKTGTYLETLFWVGIPAGSRPDGSIKVCRLRVSYLRLVLLHHRRRRQRTQWTCQILLVPPRQLLPQPGVLRTKGKQCGGVGWVRPVVLWPGQPATEPAWCPP